MSFIAIGDRRTNCGNGTCRFVNVKIYKGGELWKTIKSTSNVVKRGDPVIIEKYSLCYTTKKIDKNYTVGKKNIKAKAYFYFTPPQGSWRTKGKGITVSVKF